MPRLVAHPTGSPPSQGSLSPGQTTKKWLILAGWGTSLLFAGGCSQESSEGAAGSGASGFDASGKTGGSGAQGVPTGGMTNGGNSFGTGGSSSDSMMGGGVRNSGGVFTGGSDSGTGAANAMGSGGEANGTGATASGGGNASGGSGSGGNPPGSGGAGNPGTGGQDGDLCDAGVEDGTPELLSLSGNTFAHDPTMVQVDGTFYRFWTGDFIPMATSSDLAHWSDAPPVYDDGYSPWVSEWLSGIAGETFNFPWAPEASFFGGQVHLYSSFSAQFGNNISCISHLSTDNIAAGEWTDHGPVICTDGDENYNAIDADVALDEEGTPWLAFGSFWDGIMAFELNADGSRAGTELTQLAWASEIEAPVLFRRCGYYYLFVTWGLCCPGEGRSVNDLTYRVAVGRSENILGPYVDRDGTPMTSGGGTLVVEGDGVNWAAAGHSDIIVDGKHIYHFYHAYRQSNGAAELRIAELFFDDQGWPVAHAP